MGRDRAITSAVTKILTFFKRRFSIFSSDVRRLFVTTTLIHLALAIGLFWAGRAQVAPTFIDRDGIIESFAFDSYEYQRGAVKLTEVLKQDGIVAWAGTGAPIHVKVVSILFALLGPLFGHGPLSAEPFNLLCYVGTVGLTLALGREIGGKRAGLLAAWIVALWPTFLLHTLQLLKDPLFIAGALALVLCSTTWLTRIYSPRKAIVIGAFTAVAVPLLVLIRPAFAFVIFALVLFGLILLIIRQLIERRLLYWNMISPLLILSVGALLLLSLSPRGGQKLKHYPSDQGGRLKAAASDGVKVATTISYLPRTRPDDESPTTSTGRLYAWANRMALRVSSVRYRFAAVYAESGSSIDPEKKFGNLKDLFLYLPRAFEIGCCAPFPKMWIAAGKRVGSAGKLLSGAETLIMYIFELLALVAVFRPPHRLAAWLLLSTSAFGMTLLGLVVPNVGALYRFRYIFWILLLILGAKGLEAIMMSLRQRSRARPSQAAS